MKAALTALMMLASISAAHAEALIATLSTERIGISSNFSGEALAVFGAIERDGAISALSSYDVIITARGPRGAVTVREKERMGPLWLNMDARKYIAIPAFLSVVSNRALDDIAAPATRQAELIGIDSLVPAQADKTKDSDPEEPAFRAALIRIRTAQYLFSQNPAGVKFLSPGVFRAIVRIPGSVPLGAYTVEVAVFTGGAQIAKVALPLSVTKSGAEQQLAALAREDSFLYGLATVLMALLAGWIASVIFRRD